MTATARTWAGIALPLTFLALSVLLAYKVCIGPWLDYRRGREWEAVPCQIVRADSALSRDDSTKWAFHLEYVYEYRGIAYRGTRYSFWNETVHSSPAELPMANIGPATCFVDPRDPAAAVLSRSLASGFTPVSTAMGIANAVVLLIVISMIVHVLRAARRGTVAMLAFSMLALPYAFSAEPGSPVTWDQPQIEVQLAPVEDTANVAFTFRNTSGHEIAIDHIRSACDCFKLTADAQRYAAGEAGVLSGGFHLGTRSGSVTYRFTIQWSDVAVPDELVATFHFAPVFSTTSAFAQWEREEKPVAKEVRFTVVGDEHVHRADVTVAPKWTTVTASVEDDGRTVLIRIRPSTTERVDLGQIEVSTDHPVRSRSTISAYAWITTPKKDKPTP